MKLTPIIFGLAVGFAAAASLPASAANLTAEQKAAKEQAGENQTFNNTENKERSQFYQEEAKERKTALGKGTTPAERRAFNQKEKAEWQSFHKDAQSERTAYNKQEQTEKRTGKDLDKDHDRMAHKPATDSDHDRN
jgi:hypothetical protein